MVENTGRTKRKRTGNIETHTPIPRQVLSADYQARFWAKVSRVEGGCWEWTGAKRGIGYGCTRVPGNRSVFAAHRVACMIGHGSDPGNSLVCHRCDNPSCVNPDHLFLGDHQDNCDDKMAKGRWATGKPKNCLGKIDVDALLDFSHMIGWRDRLGYPPLSAHLVSEGRA